MTRHPVSTRAAIAALGLAAIALSACGHHHNRMTVNSGLCADFKAAPTAQAGAPPDPATPVDDCVRRWAYSLAGGRDDADVIAQSVVAACAPVVSRWNQNSLVQAGSDPASDGQGLSQGQGVSLATGEATSPLAAHASFAQQRALLYVVEARAGQCAPPPVVNGLPDGTN